ncbi:MAG: RadC family protein [Bacillota bacterium]
MGRLEYHLTIKDLPAELRPRERMLTAGSEALSNAELLAIILRTGSPAATALDLARDILGKPEGLRFLVEATLQELSNIKGIGLAKAAQLKAAVELGKRITILDKEDKPAIRSPLDAANLVMEEMRFLDREHFRCILLSTKNRVIRVETVSVGSLNSSIVHPREVFKSPVRHSAAAVILAHNHPSGDPTPSREDLEVTKRLVESGKILGIEVLDHIIIGSRGFQSVFQSLREQGGW